MLINAIYLNKTKKGYKEPPKKKKRTGAIKVKEPADYFLWMLSQLDKVTRKRSIL